MWVGARFVVYVMLVCWCSYKTFNGKIMDVFDSLAALGTFYSYGVASSNFDRMVCVKSYCNLLCCVQFILLEDLLSSEWKWRKRTSGGEGISQWGY